MRKLIIASGLIASTIFVSCKKENDKPAATDISGTWTFVSMDVNSTTTEEFNDGTGNEKTVTTDAYTTENNTGTITIAGSTMTSTNLSYTVNTTATSSYYLDGALISTFDMPFSFTAPASSGTSTFRTVSADSIYFESGTIFMNGTSQQSIPSGAKVSLDGNILYLTASMAQTTNQVVSGVNITADIRATSTVKLQRQ